MTTEKSPTLTLADVYRIAAPLVDRPELHLHGVDVRANWVYLTFETAAAASGLRAVYAMLRDPEARTQELDTSTAVVVTGDYQGVQVWAQRGFEDSAERDLIRSLAADGRLLDALAAATPKAGACTCGRPEVDDTVHRTDGPCYSAVLPVSEAIAAATAKAGA